MKKPRTVQDAIRSTCKALGLRANFFDQFPTAKEYMKGNTPRKKKAKSRSKVKREGS